MFPKRAENRKEYVSSPSFQEDTPLWKFLPDMYLKQTGQNKLP